MNENFSEQRVLLIRDLAKKADPFTKQRLIDLMRRYSDARRIAFRDIPHSLANLSSQPTSQLIAAHSGINEAPPPEGTSVDGNYVPALPDRAKF